MKKKFDAFIILKNGYRLPSTETSYSGELIPKAPDDLFVGLGKDDQKLYIVPSKNLVIVRIGNSARISVFSPNGFDNKLWEKINDLIN